MNIVISKEDEVKINKVFRALELNMEAADFYNNYLKGNLSSIDKALINKIMYEEDLNEEEAYFEALRDQMDLDPEDNELKALRSKNEIDKITKLNPLDYEDNPYYRNIHFNKENLGKWTLDSNTFYPYEGFIYEDVVSLPEDSYIEKTALGYFPTYFRYLIAEENKQVWMSITPHEINTMKEPINSAKGNVCVFGLGLGYFPYMVSLKDDVTSITIIEKDKSIIDLFNTYILPQFEHKEKIKVIQDEAFNYAHNKMNKVGYDYAFIDLWRSEFDGLNMYLHFKKDEAINSGTKFDYWIEKSLITMIRRILLTLIDEEQSGSTDEDYKKGGNVYLDVINKLHFKLKDNKINSYDDFMSLISDSNIKKLAADLY